MAVVLVTGMSGTGKSTMVRVLAGRGHRTVDTDDAGWAHWAVLPDGSRDRRWDVPAVAALIDRHVAAGEGHLVIAGCVGNQGALYPRFDAVVLLTAPAEVILRRVMGRRDNPYGRSPADRAEILANLARVEPVLRATSTHVVDATASVAAVADAVERALLDG